MTVDVAPVRGKGVTSSEQAQGVRTRSMTRVNPIPEGAVELDSVPGTIVRDVDGVEDMDVSDDPVVPIRRDASGVQGVEVQVDAAGQPVGNEDVRDPVIVGDSVFAYEYLAFLSREVKCAVEQKNPEWRERWSNTLGLNPEEVDDLNECRRPTRAESVERDRMLAFLGVDPICKDQHTLVN